MDSSQFVNEVLNSDICPEGFEAIYEGFQTYQSDVLKVLKEFHRVCEKNGVTYQLAFGSLLGAIRDGGQIPWDYDIDVIVPFEEKGKLMTKEYVALVQCLALSKSVKRGYRTLLQA